MAHQRGVATGEFVPPQEVLDIAEDIQELEDRLVAARESAVALICKYYLRGYSARGLSNKYGGPFSYLTTLKHINEMLANTSKDEKRHMARVEPSIF